MQHRSCIWTFIVTWLTCAAAGTAALAAPGVVLDESGYWRRYLCFDWSRYSPALLKSEGPKVLGQAGLSRLERDVKKEMQADGLDPGRVDWMEHAHLGGRGARSFVPWTTPPPAADWPAADFDDADWPRLRHPFQGGRQGKVTKLNLGQYESSVDLRLRASFYRARFVVDDPAKAGTLTLSLSYVGGARAFVNGTEIGRGHLPAGDITFDARGDDYPLRAYQQQDEDRRLRKLTARVPANLLRAGVNVVAVEVRASDMHPVVATLPTQPNWGTSRPWAHGRLVQARLSANSDKVTPCLHRPAGVQVWAEDVHRRVQSDDFLPPGESPGVVHIVGVKNGVFAAQVVVGTDRALRDLHVTVSDLTLAPAGSTLPASSVRVSWPAPYPAAEFDLEHTHDERGLSALFPSNAKLWQAESTRQSSRVSIFDHLVQDPPAALPADYTQPLWLSLHVPPDAECGTYTGTVTVGAQGVPGTTLPVRLEVVDWRLPDPRDFKTIVGCEESPWAVAKQYGVTAWSERHWALLDASFRELARLGNGWLNVPVLQKSEFGNLDDAMVRFVRRRDGSYDADFTTFDRYLEVATKHGGPPRVVVFVVMHGMKPQDPKDIPTVLCRDERSGRTSPLTVGGPGLSRQEKETRWQGFAQAVVAHMKSKGLEKALTWGYPLEGEADPELKDILAKAAPGVGWIAGPHEMMSNGTYAKQERYYRIVADIRYHGGWGSFRDDMGWKSRTMHLLNPRAGGTALAVHTTSLPFIFRVLPERALSFGRGGFTRVGVDDWGSLHYEGMNLPKWLTGIPVLHLLWPGRSGAEPGVRFEMLLEGIQETEARIAVEQMLDGGRAAGPAAANARKILARRVDETRFFLGNSLIPAFEEYYYGWQSRSRELYQAAAEVAKASRP